MQPLISGDEMELILLERLFLVLYEWFRCITGGRQHKVKHLIIRVIKRILSSFRYLLLHGVVKIFLLPVGVANVIASSSSPWKPIIYSCKQTRPISLNKKFYLKKKTLYFNSKVVNWTKTFDKFLHGVIVNAFSSVMTKAYCRPMEQYRNSLK